MEIIKSGAYDSFACIASACPDSCCQLWDVEIDSESLARYRVLPAPLGDSIRAHLAISEDGACFETVEGRCPMWRRDGLCEIQAQLGHEALCQTCRQFPRLTHDYGDFQEWGLELSCPEAARLLLSADREDIRLEAPGTGEGDYDPEEMALLRSTKAEALKLIRSVSPSEAPAVLLLYGYHVQSMLEGFDVPPFSPEAALETAAGFAGKGSLDGIFDFLKGLEILCPGWEKRLSHYSTPKFGTESTRLLDYFIRRYWLQAVSDADLAARVKFMVTSAIAVSALGGSFITTAQAYSKEVENCTENMDAFLDAAYDCPTLTDDKLLGILCAILTTDN